MCGIIRPWKISAVHAIQQGGFSGTGQYNDTLILPYSCVSIDVRNKQLHVKTMLGSGLYPLSGWKHICLSNLWQEILVLIEYSCVGCVARWSKFETIEISKEFRTQ